MHGQGLSIRYIVVLALAILVLIVVALMLYRSQSSSNAINRESATNTCRDLCVQAENLVANAGGTSGVDYPGLGAPKYCTVTLNIDGQQKHCYEIYTCKLVDADGDSEILNADTCSSFGG